MYYLCEMMYKIVFICFFILCFVASPVSGQNKYLANRAGDSTYFKAKDLRIEDDVVYGKAENWKGEAVSLKMTIIYPKLSIDSIKKRH